MNAQNSNTSGSHLALLTVVAAGAGIWFALQSDSMPRWAVIVVLIAAIGVACGGVGAMVRLMSR